ncbi:GGDEF domain-containing protein [Methylobacterium sp. Leaf118]|uniref:GGDEF domain-containing protein n=1 Tax=Methylobacterium sp. Leaf118 TaxID=2876562 RepID=UPI001E416DE7|nr:GGDEF domain-containing protein [Methylobacterium sp. Leaf118]
MSDLPDIPTLRLCSMLASLAFFGVFACLWVGRRDEGYFLHWGGGSLLYAGVICSYDYSAHTPLQDGLLYALLSASTLLVLTGVRRFDGRAPFPVWLLLPMLVSGLGYGVPAHLFGGDSAWARIGGTCGSLLTMALVGGRLVLERTRSAPRGRRIAGAALLGYIPAFLAAIAAEAFGTAAVNMAALIPMLADQLLLAVLNLGLIAMPGERAQAALREAALRDPLTGAWNRAGLAALAPGLLRPGTAVIAFDIDHFKAINDGHGHATGDRVLAALVTGARAVLPEAEAPLARLGGDEFVMLLPGRSRAEASWYADAIRREIRALAARSPDLPPWTISLGIGAIEPGDREVAQAIERADRSLYRAKAEGRDRAA